MKTAVVTPYFREDDQVLRQCLNSVAAQTHPATHILVADGFAKSWAAAAVSHHLVLPGSGHADCGNLARCLGSMMAVAEGFDAIAMLDADNWFHPDHLGSLIQLHRQTGAALCTSARSIRRPDGSLLIEKDDFSDGEDFADTSCLFYFRESFGVLPVWGQMAARFGPIGDRVMWSAIRARRLSRAHSNLPTMAFRSSYSIHFEQVGEPPPAGCKPPGPLRALLDEFEDLPLRERRRLLVGY